MPNIYFKQLFVLLYMMAGPLNVAPSFAAIAGHLSATERRRLAVRAVLMAIAGLLITIFAGHGTMSSWGIGPQAVAGAAGLLLSLSALQAITGKPVAAEGAPAPDPALSPLAFPILLPPYAIGVIILFTAHFNGTEDLLRMSAIAVGIMAGNLLAMHFAQAILRVLHPAALQVLGSVFGVLQLSLGIEMLLYAVRVVRS